LCLQRFIMLRTMLGFLLAEQALIPPVPARALS
jgi:hypothetical protein